MVQRKTSIKLLILFGIKRNYLSSGKSRLFYLFIRSVMKQTAITIEKYRFSELQTKLYQTFFCHGYPHMRRKLLVIISVSFDVTGQLLIIYSAFVKYLTKNGNTMGRKNGGRNAWTCLGWGVIGYWFLPHYKKYTGGSVLLHCKGLCLSIFFCLIDLYVPW
jgi:hypothetical protein